MSYPCWPILSKENVDRIDGGDLGGHEQKKELKCVRRAGGAVEGRTYKGSA